jgi:hypothetical protein
MKPFALILCLIVGLAVADAQASSNNNRVMTNADRGAEVKLQLSTSVSEQRYSVDAGSRLLRMTLNLTYSNIGSRPILLDKKSSLIYRKMISRNLKAVSDKKYEYDESSSFIDVRSMQAAGMQMDMRRTPEREAFVTLKPGESYSLKKELILQLYDGTTDTEEFLHPGTYLLQVKVATWYYFVDPEKYREQWSAEGYLWSRDITSVPMPLRVEKKGS